MLSRAIRFHRTGDGGGGDAAIASAGAEGSLVRGPDPLLLRAGSAGALARSAAAAAFVRAGGEKFRGSVLELMT